MTDTASETTAPEKQAPDKPDKPDTGEKDWAAEAEKWKALARKHEGAAKQNADAIRQLDELQNANASDLEKAIKAAREEGRAEIRTASDARTTASEAKALAAVMGFRKPEHAVRLVNLAEVKVDADGEPDSAAIRSLLDELAKDDPLLLAVPDDGRPRGDVDQGPRDRAVSTNPRQADLDQIEADMAASRRK